jgi:hypothetical protein
MAPSLTSGRVYNLLFLLGLASEITLGSEPRGTQDHTLLSQFFRLPQPGGSGPLTYIPQVQGSPVIILGTEFPFVAPNDSQGYSGGILSQLHKYTFIPKLSTLLYALLICSVFLNQLFIFNTVY